jgi:uncharacterized membrane protein YraQ (UPF0718 family)
MEIVIKLFQNFWTLTNDMAIYILLGVLFAGVLKQLIPQNFISSHLSKNSFSSVVKASLFGLPLPLCSCSVIPFATTLKKEGASKGSVLSFLISTPITGVDSILATYGFFGWVFTLYRVATSVVIALIAGILQNILENETTSEDSDIKNSCCNKGGCSSNEANKNSEKFSLKKAFDYAIFDIFKDFAKPLFWGLVAGALITTFIPEDLSSYLGENRFLSYILMLVVSVPLYICATASLPIAASLILSGVSPGAAFVLLSAGPATNSVTIGVVGKILGKRALFIYLGVISVLSLLFGYLFDRFFETVDIAYIANSHESFSTIDNLSSLLMLGLIGYFFIKK